MSSNRKESNFPGGISPASRLVKRDFRIAPGSPEIIPSPAGGSDSQSVIQKLPTRFPRSEYSADSKGDISVLVEKTDLACTTMLRIHMFVHLFVKSGGVDSVADSYFLGSVASGAASIVTSTFAPFFSATSFPDSS
jgi:hypothetical protein